MFLHNYFSQLQLNKIFLLCYPLVYILKKIFLYFNTIYMNCNLAIKLLLGLFDINIIILIICFLTISIPYNIFWIPHIHKYSFEQNIPKLKFF